jgi:lipopolysaccharide transport system ATP-binding protein
LLVDEVLSIGDVDFQRKSFNKMREVVNSGRSVIFVSHNIPAVLSFTKKAIYLKNGHIEAMGETDKIVARYLADNKGHKK